MHMIDCSLAMWQEAANSWTFNIFDLADATNNRPLSTLGFYLLKVCHMALVIRVIVGY